VDLYDRAGNLPKVIWALEIFTQERPDDPLAPEASLRLGRAYHASGLFDKAIAVYQRTQFRYPKSLAASKAAVPLAQACIAQGSDQFARAEKVLLGVLENNPILTPAAEEFRQALLELAQLYYREARYEEAIAKLEEFVKRYPDEPRMAHLLFTMGDSYRKSANLLDAKTALAAKKDRLTKAKKLFDDVVEMSRTKANVDPLELKLSHFYRADCTYDLGQYEDAIKLYDTAALKYQDDPSALAAYVQIVNAYCALGKTDQARAANERAKWLLRRMPGESFAAGGYTMPKTYWEQWLKWTGQVGMW
jgi:TolA-binding protein